MTSLYTASSVGTAANRGILYKAWAEMYASASPFQRANTSGVDQVTLETFKRNLEANLYAISSSMRSASHYEFSALHPIRVKKPSGKSRIICVPTVADRIVQKAIQAALIENGRWKFACFDRVNYGFVRGKKVADAISQAVTYRTAHPFVYKTDIQSFFDSINRAGIKDRIRQVIPHKSLHPLLFNAVDCEIASVSSTLNKIIREVGIERGKGVRQGLPLSPLFSNLYLYDFDVLVRKERLNAVRYADDIVFFSDSEAGCYKIHAFCTEKLAQVGLRIPDLGSDSKTIIAKPEEPIEFLGITIEPDAAKQYHPTISAAQRKYIRDAILNFGDLKYLADHAINIASYAQRLRSMVAGFDGAYHECMDTTILRESMMQWARAACRELFTHHFGIRLDKIDTSARRFIEIV